MSPPGEKKYRTGFPKASNHYLQPNQRYTEEVGRKWETSLTRWQRAQLAGLKCAFEEIGGELFDLQLDVGHFPFELRHVLLLFADGDELVEDDVDFQHRLADGDEHPQVVVGVDQRDPLPRVARRFRSVRVGHRFCAIDFDVVEFSIRSVHCIYRIHRLCTGQQVESIGVGSNLIKSNQIIRFQLMNWSFWNQLLTTWTV